MPRSLLPLACALVLAASCSSERHASQTASDTPSERRVRAPADVSAPPGRVAFAWSDGILATSGPTFTAMIAPRGTMQIAPRDARDRGSALILETSRIERGARL